ncbi:MAG TPA: hypothetical protein VMB03_06185 [Bryobacteraceae bacterium]|nr:hypothetical protein [Bryobacteraceae bacterium]
MIQRQPPAKWSRQSGLEPRGFPGFSISADPPGCESRPPIAGCGGIRPSCLRPIALLCLLAAGVSAAAAQKWEIQYFYDHAKSSFVICDMQFPSASRGVAVGVIREGRREDPSSVVTADGGLHWQTVPLKEPPVSLFFLNENLGWLVTTKGLWQTVEAGRSWTKLPKLPAEIFRVYFIDEKHGWGIGPKKTALETRDGGQSWSPLVAASAQDGEDVNFSCYTWIAFATPRNGLITGWNIPPRRFDTLLPNWMDPDTALRQRETPHLSFSLTTSDSGAEWSAASASLFGVISRVRFAPEGKGLELTKYSETFRYPSEVSSLEWPGGENHTVFRDAKFDVTDIWLASDGTAYLSGSKVRGKLRGVIPDKVEVFTSKDLDEWTPIPVDYRAEASSTILAAPDDDHLWLATDTGMILKLVR